MTRLRFGLPLVALLLTLTPPPAHGQPAPRLDAQGDPLPAGAVARLGSTRFRHRGNALAGMSADGKTLLFVGGDGLLVMDGDTGLVTRRISIGEELTLLGLRGGRRQDPLAALAADGKTVAVVQDGFISGLAVHDVATGKRLLHFPGIGFGPGGGGPDSGYSFIALNADGKILMLRRGPAKDKDNDLIEIYDVATKKSTHQIAGDKGTQFRGLTVSDDGTLLLYVAQDMANNKAHLHVWDIAKGEEIRKFAVGPDHAERLQLLPGGKHLFALNGGASLIRLLDPATGKEKQQFTAAAFPVQSFLASRDGTMLFAASAKGVQQWDATNGKEVRLLKGKGEFTGDKHQLALSPGGERLYVAGATTVTVWDVKAGKEVRPITGHDATVWVVAFSPDGSQVLTTSADGTARLWDAKTHKQVRQFAPGVALAKAGPRPRLLDAPQVQAGFLGDGKLIAINFDESPVFIWDPAADKEVRKFEDFKGGPPVIAVSPRDEVFATVHPDGSVRLWDARSGKQKLTFPWHTQETRGGPDESLAAAAFSPDGATLAVSGLVISREGVPTAVCKLFELRTARERLNVDLLGKMAPVLGQLNIFFLIDRLVLGMAYAPDGKTLALGSIQGVRLHSTVTGKEKAVLAGGQVFGKAVALSPDGTLVAAGTLEGTVRLWNVQTGALVRDVPAHDYFVAGLAFSPDGKTLATASDDATVLVWDVAEMMKAAPPPVGKGSDLDRLWKELADGDAMLAFQAVAELIEAKATVDYLKERLKAVSPVDAKVLEQLLADLGSDAYPTRQKATVALEKLADLAGGALRKKLEEKPALEMRKRIELLLDKLEGPVTSPDLLRVLRAVEVLEHIGTPEARAVLEALAKGAPGHRLTEAAAGSVKRMTVPKAGAVQPPKGADLDQLWKDLASAEAEKAFQAIGEMVKAKTTVAFLKERLKPAQPADAKAVAQLLTDLASDTDATWKKAAAALEQLGDLAGPALRKKLEDKPAPALRKRIEALLDKLDGPVTLPELMRTIRAIEVLELIGTPEARAVLETLAKGAAGHRVTEEAAGSVKRLNNR
jgi:WD40 repeat protein